MDEFTAMAITIMAVFFAVNVMVVSFEASADLQNHGMTLTNFEKSDLYTTTSLDAIKNASTQNCTFASQNLVDIIPCEIAKVVSPVTKLVGDLWTFATSWVQLINLIVAPLPAPAQVFANLLIPILGLIQLTAIIVLMMKFAAIIRGVAGGFL